MLKRLWAKLPAGLKYLIKNYLLAIAVFAAFRTVLLFVGIKQLSGVPAEDILMAYVNGWRFDTSVTGYLLAIPTILVVAVEMSRLKHIAFKRTVFIINSVLMCVGFMVSAADIPYYFVFNARMTSSIFNWFSSPSIVFGYLLENVDYYIYTVLFIAVCYFFVRTARRFYRSWHSESVSRPPVRLWALKYATIYLLGCVFLFAGIRGKVFTRRPLSWAEAFTSVHNFPNQLGLNPVFTLGNSLTTTKNGIVSIQLLDDNAAVDYVCNMLGVPVGGGYSSPIAREEKYEGEAKNYNVVLVVMESMTKANAAESGFYKSPVTPFLDSIRARSVNFSNVYSLGIHTYNGIWSIFTSTPAPPTEDNPLQFYDNALTYSGIGQVLHESGYSTYFACPHDINFDNMGGFLMSNGFEDISGLNNELLNKDFINVWGISDHILFDNSLPALEKLSKAGRPFFATLLTVSNHSPFNIPEPYPQGFNPKYTEKREIAIEYADWSIARWFESVSKETWFDNTIFVFVSDHGMNVFPNYEVNLNYNRIQMFFYAPKIFGQGRTESGLALQVDLFPTLMGMLNRSYVNNTMGIDLLRRKRDAVYFSANTTIAALNDSLLMIRRDDGSKTLYDYRNYSLENIADKYPDATAQLERLALSNFQTSVWMLKSGKGKYEKR